VQRHSTVAKGHRKGPADRDNFASLRLRALAWNHAVHGETLQLHIRLANQSDLAIHAEGLTVTQAGVPQRPTESEPTQILPGEVYELTIPEWQVNAPPTRPHWSREIIAFPMYETQLNGKQRPLPPAPFQIQLPVVLQGQRIELSTVVQKRIRHPDYGLVEYPLTVVPAISVRFASDAGVIPRGKTEYKLPVRVHSSRKGPTTAVVKLKLPQGWASHPAEEKVGFQREGDEATVVFDVMIPAARLCQAWWRVDRPISNARVRQQLRPLPVHHGTKPRGGQ
jgi:hypothetical protein